MPPEEERRIEATARWSDGDDAWSMPHLALTGNRRNGAGGKGSSAADDGYYAEVAKASAESDKMPNPFQHYAGDEGDASGGAATPTAADAKASKTGKKDRPKSARPKSSSRRRDDK